MQRNMGRLTSPTSRRSLSTRSSTTLRILPLMAILTCTSLVEIKSTIIPYRSNVPKIRAKKPCEIVFLFERMERTRMSSLIVMAVGRRGWERSISDGGVSDPFAADASAPPALPFGPDEVDDDDVSGKMIVPPPLGFSTFLIRIGILARITCSIVNGWMTSDP